MSNTHIKQRYKQLPPLTPQRYWTPQRLKETRVALGYTQQQMATKLAIAVNSWAMYERGLWPISERMDTRLRAIAPY